ncbi:hypothetical protein P691DRAFT_706609 [Macrolepiota fuliginosa MF-IS2]|uniref:Uncharacterized protein n=1 Tax=Macrolepiota fuliginosa MF-IS2 TaxID=1400762 RepID=A0A9P5X9Y3_9AGAR|nr:hypothetical protein P691DRAFT_706609 [Macrolepiota fuliginosa MF-IS2]
MDVTPVPDDDALSAPEYTDDPVTEISEVSTPVTFSAEASPLLSELPLPSDPTIATQKKKKKKKSKKSAKAKATEAVGTAAEAAASKARSQDAEGGSDDRPSVLCINRNKHWRYISSYHGPWLQLPAEFLDTLLTLNLDPALYAASIPRSSYSSYSLPTSPISPSGRFRSFPIFDDLSPPESPHKSLSSFTISPGGMPTPPPIDPGVLRSVAKIKGLIEEATELSVRASSGLSAVELGSMRGGSSYNGSSWTTAQSLGLGSHGTSNGGGRNVNMSANRVHRLRALAVQKLAQAYRMDEIASSVMVMQGGSVFDDVAERVLKHDPSDADAKYVHFFHEKIPSSHRQLAESTTTAILDDLIRAYPHQLEYYRTRGVVHCFREEFTQATRDFTHALKETRAQRRAKLMHRGALGESRASKSKKRKGTSGHAHTNGQVPSDGTSVPEGMFEAPDGELLPLHPSMLPDAPEPIETQLLFLRGAAYLQQAVHLIESTIIDLEGVQKPTSVEGVDLRLCCLENGRYGGVEIGNPDGPLGSPTGAKVKAYREVLATKPFRDQINSLLKKSMRDHEKFLSHFDGGSPNVPLPEGDIASQVEYAFLLSEPIRPGQNSPPPNLPEAPPALTTYHPLLLESHFSVLICYLLLADFSNILTQFAKTAVLLDGVDGYPIFLPPRSMGQGEFVEVLERLAAGWKAGTQPHSLAKNIAPRGKGRLTGFDMPRLITPSVSQSSTYTSSTVPTLPSTPSTSVLLANAIAGIDLSAFSAPPSSSLTLPPASLEYFNGPSSSSSSTLVEMCTEPSASSSSSTLLQPDMLAVTDQNHTAPTLSATVSRKNSTHGLNSSLPSPSISSSSYQPGGSSKDKAKQLTEGDQELHRTDTSHALDCARILLAPVIKRQRQRTEQLVAERVAGIKKKTMPISIPLHGPRVEIILAWLGAVHLPELEEQ